MHPLDIIDLDRFTAAVSVAQNALGVQSTTIYTHIEGEYVVLSQYVQPVWLQIDLLFSTLEQVATYLNGVLVWDDEHDCGHIQLSA